MRQFWVEKDIVAYLYTEKRLALTTRMLKKHMQAHAYTTHIRSEMQVSRARVIKRKFGFMYQG